jgi:hypothetical protein
VAASQRGIKAIALLAFMLKMRLSEEDAQLFSRDAELTACEPLLS